MAGVPTQGKLTAQVTPTAGKSNRVVRLSMLQSSENVKECM